MQDEKSIHAMNVEKRRQEYLKLKAEGKTEKWPVEKANVRYISGSSEGEAEIRYWSEGTPVYSENFLEIDIGGKKYSSASIQPFNKQLDIVREQLEADGIELRCNGTSKRFTLTPLGVSMADGLKGVFVELETGEIKKKAVDLFGYQEGEEWTTVKEQGAAIDNWLKIRLNKLNKNQI